MDLVGVVFPVMSLGKVTITHLVFVDDLQLVIGIGVFLA